MFLSFDITSIFNTLVSESSASLGIRLQTGSIGRHEAITFNNFQLTTDNQSTTGIPEPATIAFLSLGLAGIGISRKKKRD